MLRVFEPHITKIKNRISNGISEGWISSAGPYIEEFGKLFAQLSVSHMQFP